MGDREIIKAIIWSQLPLVITIIGYFVKRAFDNKSKKIEINHSLFQQNRINAVNNFFSNYAKVELMWDQIAIYDILSNKLNPKEIDEIIFPLKNALRTSLLELKIYFDTSKHKYFLELENELSSINGKLKNLYFHESGKDIITKANEFTFFKDDVIKKNNKIMNDLCDIIRASFRSY